MRADARRNYERLLAAAREAFSEDGAGASLDDIARRANVGPGTLYRHFPTREALLAAIAASMAVPGHGVRFAYGAHACELGWCLDGAFGFGRPCDDRPGWRTINVGVRRGRYLLPRRLDLQPSRAMPLRFMLAVESHQQRMAWARLGWDDARRYFG